MRLRDAVTGTTIFPCDVYRVIRDQISCDGPPVLIRKIGNTLTRYYYTTIYNNAALLLYSS
jgi:hypothetical protein